MKIDAKNTKSAQEIQDDIFRGMDADQKVKLGSDFWKLAKDLVGDKIDYGKNRPEKTFGDYRQASQ